MNAAGLYLLMKTITLCQLLLGTEQLRIHNLVIEEDQIGVEVESTALRAPCPACGHESAQIHSTYPRDPIDLAWADWGVVLHLQVKRFFCRNPNCPKVTFAERFPGYLARYARKTDRVLEMQRQIGLEVCARSAERLLQLCRLGISDTTVNRLLRRLPDPPTSKLRAVGVDDWAKCKGQRYGTILVDGSTSLTTGLERSQIVDLLMDRTAEAVKEWLSAQEGLEFVSRDRSKTYAEAITVGAPQAIQVADRWHLLKNLSEAVFKLLQKNYALIKQQLGPESDAIHREDVDERPAAEFWEDETDALTPAEERRRERIAKTLLLHDIGWTQKDIADQLNIHPKTVRRYLHSPDPRARRTRGVRLIDPYRPYLLERWNAGCHNAAQLYREISARGYRGQVTMVREYLRRLRQASGLPPKVRNQSGNHLEHDPAERPPSLRELVWYVVRRREDREAEHERILDRIREQAEVDATIRLARSFSAIVRDRQPTELDEWLRQAENSKIAIWRNFAAGLQQDYAAVRAALIHDWSNGPTEGHINRLKFLKRLMYGRANDDLLRKRVIWQGRWSFT